MHIFKFNLVVFFYSIGSTMKYKKLKFFFERVRSLILNPRNEWEVINNENNEYRFLFKEYVLLLALIPAFVNFVGYALIGYRVQFVGLATSFTLGLKLMVVFYIATVIAIYSTAWIIQYFALRFSATQSFNKTFELVLFTYFVIIAIGMLNISPSMSRMVSFLNLYCLYIFYFGFRKMIQIKTEKAFVYFAISTIILIVIYFLLFVWIKGHIIVGHESFNI